MTFWLISSLSFCINTNREIHYIQKAVINLRSINEDGFVKNLTDTILVIPAPDHARGRNDEVWDISRNRQKWV